MRGSKLVVAYSTAGQTCAVVGCPEVGKVQLCVFDGRYHRHGLTHYGNQYPPLAHWAFRQGDWFRVCDTHQARIAEAMADHIAGLRR